MISYSVGHEFKEIWLPMLDDIIPSESSSLKYSQSIVTVYSATGDSISDGLGDDTVGCILIFKTSRDGIFVVPEQEEGLTLQSSCEVESSREVAFTCSSFTEITSSYLLLLCHSKSVT